MASDIFGFEEDEQEGGLDATQTGASTSAIDSGMGLTGTHGVDAIKNARLRAMAKDPDDIMTEVQGTREGSRPVVPMMEQLGSMFSRFGQAIGAGTGDVAMGAALSRENVDNPAYMVDKNLDFAHMSPAEQAEVVRKMEGKSPEEQRNIRVDSYIEKRDEFIQSAKDFQEWMPKVGAQKTSGALGMLDEAMTGMAQFLPTMGAGAFSGGAMSMPVAYMQLLPGKFDEYTKAGLSKERAFKYAQGAAIALAAVEAGGTNIQLSKLKQAFTGKEMGKGFLSNIVDQVVSNGITEGFEELTQAELEVMFDVSAKNPDATPEEIGKKVWDVYKDPEFQKGAGYQAIIGFIGGGVMGGGGAIAGEVGSRVSHRIESHGEGKHVVIPDEVDNDEKDIRDEDIPEDGRPSVRNLMGGKSSDEAVEGAIEDAGDGMAVGGDLQTTPKQAETQLQTNVAIESVLEEMQLKKSMQSDKIDIINNQNKLDTLNGLFNDAVEIGDHEEALTLAEQYKKTVDDSAAKLENFTSTKNRRLNKDKAAINPRSLTDIAVYVDELTRRAGDMVNTQVNAVKAKENQDYMDFQDSLREDKKVLKQSLIDSEEKSTNLNNPTAAKVYRNVADTLDKERWMTRDEFLGKAIKKDKVIETMGDLERKISKEKEDVKIPGTVKATDEATLDYLNRIMADKAEYDFEQARIKRIQAESRTSTEASQRLTSTVTPMQERQARARKQAETVKKAQEATALAKQKKEEADRAAKQSEMDKRRAAIQRQQAAVRKTPAIPVPDSRKADLEDSRSRKAELRKQEEISKKLDKTKPHKLPAKVKTVDLKTPEAEYVIVTPDNPKSTPRSATENRAGRVALAKELDNLGIDYEIGESMFEGTAEAPFIIKGMTKDQGQKLSDQLNQTSFIHGSGENISLVEGKKVNRVSKKEIRQAPDATDYFTKINGEKFTVPFFTEKATDINLDTAQYQLGEKDSRTAQNLFRSAAIKFNGKIYEGPSHISIFMGNQILEDFVNKATIQELSNQVEQGFTTHEGKFVDRFSASRQLGLKKDSYLTSEDFMEPVLDAKAEAMAGAGIEVGNFKKMTLAGKMGTLEAMDALKKQMETGKYKFLFDKTKASKIKTVFATGPGQYGSIDAVKSEYPNLRAREDSIKRFDGYSTADPKTGQMVTVPGSRGLFLPNQRTAIINLPAVNRTASDLDKAMETVVHEHVHALVEVAEREMTTGQKQSLAIELRNLWDSIPADYRNKLRDNPETHPSIRNGIVQIDEHLPELITYSLAHPEFAAWLDSIPASPKFRAKKSRIRTMWDGLVDLILNKVAKVPSKHNELQAILNKHLQLGKDENVRFSKEGKHRWTEPIKKYKAYVSKNPEASPGDVATATGLTKYQVETIHENLNQKTTFIGNMRYSQESFDFGDNVSKDTVQEWTNNLEDSAPGAIKSTVVQSTAEAEKLLGYKITGNVPSFWAGETTIKGKKIHGTNKKAPDTVVPEQVVFIADNIESQQHFIEKWMHEQVGHNGLRKIFANNALFNRFLDNAYTLFVTKDKATLDSIIDLYDIGSVDEKGNRKLNKAQKREAAEEVIASRVQVLKPEVKKSIIAKFRAFLNKWLPKVFVDVKNDFKMTDKYLETVMASSREYVMTGKNEFGQLMQKALDRRAPRYQFKDWKTLPGFVMPDKTYIQWMKDVQKDAPHIRKWYEKHTETIRESFGDDADLFNIFLAITSPQADVNTNVIFAVQTYAYAMGLVDKPGALFANKLKERMDTKWGTIPEMLANLESNQFKVTEFLRALSGDEQATVGDLWMYRAFFGDSAVYDKEVESYSKPMSVALRQKLHDLAGQMSAETGDRWTPREVQAAIWIYINAKQTGVGFTDIADYQSGLLKPSKKFDGKSPIQWLKDLVPNLNDAPLQKKLGIKQIPQAPISTLAKQRIMEMRRDMLARGEVLKNKFTVDADGNILLSEKLKDVDETTQVIMEAITKGGTTISVPAEAAPWYKKTFGFQPVETTNDIVDMQLSDEALALYVDKKGKPTFGRIRDNLGGFSGSYTQVARFARDAKKNLDQIKAMDTQKIDAAYLKTGNDGSSVLNKIHEWRDQSELNWNRFTENLEQEFLDQFGGRKSRVKVLGSGRKLNTADTELLQKAMNLYIDSGTGKNYQKVSAYIRKLEGKYKDGTLTNREREQLEIMDRMDNLTEEERSWADSTIRPYYEDSFKFAQDEQIIDSHVDDYVKRSWKMPGEFRDADVMWSGHGTSGFTLTLDSGKKRTLDSIVDGWENGMDLKSDGVIQNLQNYGTELGYTYANRRFVNYMRGLIDFSADGLMFEVSPKTQPDFKQPGGFVRITDRGFAKPGHILYARKDIGTMINKLGARATRDFWNSPALKTIRKINAALKSTILSVSLFHHFAGMRSYVFGVTGKGWKLNPISAYKRGLAKIDERPGFENPDYKHLGPVVDLLIKEGLTIGKTQDWDQSAIQESMLEEMLRNRSGKLSFTALKAWQGARRTKRSLTGGLFNRLFAGLKAESAALELGHRLKGLEADARKEGRAVTDSEIKKAAQMAARLVNADFGGLHLSRMGRNPNYQRVAQMFFLAPDWTESNWRTVTGMVPGLNKVIGKTIGDTQFDHSMSGTYAKFWGGIALRGLTSVALANVAMMTLFGNDDDWEDYGKMLDEQFSMKNFAKGRWLSVNMTPLYRTLGMEDPEKRPLLSIMGHFKDILKLGDLRSLVKHKVSPVARVFETAWSGTDWKDSRFTTLNELLEDGTLVAQNKFAEQIDPISSSWATLASLILYNTRQSIPIFASEFLQYLQGESSGLSALGRAAGMDIRDTSRAPVAQQKFEEINSEINELNKNLDDAKTLKDKERIVQARGDIKDFKDYNRIKARLGFTKTQVAYINKKLKPLKLKRRDDIELSAAEELEYQKLNNRKQEIYEKALVVLER